MPLNLCETKSQGNIWVLNIIEIWLSISSIFESTPEYLTNAKVLKIQEYDYLGYSLEDTLFSLNLNFCLLSVKQQFANVLQNRCSEKFFNIHRKTLVLKSLLNKVAGLKKETPTQALFCEYYEIFKSSFFIEHLR